MKHGSKCLRMFKHKKSLERHIQVHHEQKGEHICQQCDKLFSTKDSLKGHIKQVHQGERNYECKDCGHKFSQHSGLKKHISNLLSYVNILLLTGKKDLLPEKLQGLDISTKSPVVLTREIISTVLQNEEEDDKFNCNLYL